MLKYTCDNILSGFWHFSAATCHVSTLWTVLSMLSLAHSSSNPLSLQVRFHWSWTMAGASCAASSTFVWNFLRENTSFLRTLTRWVVLLSVGRLYLMSYRLQILSYQNATSYLSLYSGRWGGANKLFNEGAFEIRITCDITDVSVAQHTCYNYFLCTFAAGHPYLWHPWQYIWFWWGWWGWRKWRKWYA